jgi:predicted ATP-grasp superfamily ATP-dependent carboligase
VSAVEGRSHYQPRSHDRPRVLLTNAEERSILAAIRSLQRAGYDVAGASHTWLAPGQWSRSCRWRARVADPRVDAELFVEQLRAELQRRPYDILLAGSDGALLAISRGRERLQDLTELGLPSPAVVERSLTRECLAQAAARAGMTAASSIRCTGIEQALAAADQLGFPLALKSVYAATADAHTVRAAPKGRIVRSTGDLIEALPDFPGELLLQRYVAGDLISFAGVAASGRLLGCTVTRYRRTWPPDGGSVSFGETIVPPPGLAEATRRLLADIGWEGIFELELIHMPLEGSFVPIDLNPRPYGSLALAAAAGAPLAAIWCDWLLRGNGDASQAQPMCARPGFSYRWEDGDLRHMGHELRAGRWRAALAPLRPHHGVTHAHFQRSDPLPLLARALYLGKRSQDSLRS